MIILGLTGSIATGKTFVANHFKALNYKVFVADEYVHKLMQQNKRIIEMVSRFFPEVIEHHSIERRKLADIVFKDVKQLSVLEEIIHPFIEQEILWFLEKVTRYEVGLCVLEIPLLLEKNLSKYCHYVMVTHCNGALQKTRALQREGMTEDKFQAILSHQLPQEEKKQNAQFLVDTSGVPGDTINQIDRIIDTLHLNQKNKKL
jgi:dephospho-CoA kinase